MGLRTGLTTQDPYSKKEYTELCISIPRLSKWSVARQVFFFSNRQKTRFCSLKLSVLTLWLEPEINNKERSERCTIGESWLILCFYYIIRFCHQGPVVRRPISAQPRVKFNRGFFFCCSKAFSRTIFSVILRASNHQLFDKKN